MKIKYVISLCVLFLSLGKAQAQNNIADVSIDLPTVALLDIEPSGTLVMSFSVPGEAGAPLVNPTDNSKWLNYTSAIRQGDPLRNVTAMVSSTILGIDIKLEVATTSGLNSGGNLGTPVQGPVTLGTNPINIIIGIGGAYTGDGSGNGHQLTISLVPNNYSVLKAQSTNVNIIYTITGN